MSDDNSFVKAAPPLKPPKVAPPKAPPPGRARPQNATILMLGGAGLALLFAVMMFWGLPRILASDAPEEMSNPAATPVGPSAQPITADALEQQKAKRQAETVLGRVVRQQAVLIEAKADIWAAADLDAALTRLAEGDALFQNEAYGAALAAYQAVEVTLQAMEASRPARLEAALRDGAAHLSVNAVDRAIEHYQVAVALAPDNQEASGGLARAQARTEVLAQMAAADGYHRQGDLAAARAAYQAALKLDGDYAPARAALRQVETEITDQRFSQAMSSGFAALDAGRFDAAQQAFAQARALKPQSDQPVLAAQQLERARQQTDLAQLRTAAQADVAREAWGQAVEAYQKALAIDPNVAFAVQGLAQAQTRARMDAAIMRYLDDPTRLYSREPLARAVALIDSIDRVEAPGPKLQAQRDALAKLIDAARTPLSVTLLSDGQTLVDVFTVASLGQFTEKRLSLTPGDYVAQGTRKGYRDVRVEFSVRPGQAPATISVICKEAL